MCRKKENILRMKIYKLILICILIVGCLGACNNKDKSISSGDENDAFHELEENTKETFAMDTYMTFTAYGDNSMDAVSLAIDMINELEAKISVTDSNSYIYELNEKGEVVVDDEILELVLFATKMYEKTNGKFNIAIYPVSYEWGFTNKSFAVPKDEVIKEKLKLINFNNIDIDTENKVISFKEKDMKLDLGGIAKGYISSKIINKWKELGIEYGLINLGGNVETLGNKPNGELWKVAITDPIYNDEFLGIVSVENKAVITSGGYERYFEENGKIYHHIIDPNTGYPADSGILSATIIAKNGELADSLSTTFFIMGKDEAIEFWEENRDEFEMILFDENKEVYITEGLKDTFTSEYEINIIGD